jgi:ATP synthase protein I
MGDDRKFRHRSARSAFSREVGLKETRKLRARHVKARNVWFGLGMFGLVGWSVSVPTLVGIAVGIWVDQHFSSHYSWTLMLLFTGLLIGCLNAWQWIAKEQREIRKEQEKEDPEHNDHA